LTIIPLVLVVALVAFVCVLMLGLGYAVYGEPYRPIFRRHRLGVLPGWPRLSIVHISDLHVRNGDQRLFRAQRAALRGLTPDLLCVTGDVCEKVADIQMVVELLQTVKPRLGTFVVLGNHEHGAPLPILLHELHQRGWRKALSHLIHMVAPTEHSDGEDEGHAMADALREAGITVLHNEGQRVVANGHSLWIAGCDSAWAGHADMQAAMLGKRADEACLALIHEPDLAFEASALGGDLILAGHTHGGQVRFPLVGALYTLRMDPRIAIAAGFQRIEEALLHITTGLGHTIPLRFGVPPEVVWLECEPSLEPTELTRAA
jgi:predicted MPP superfamily phosphohydrolase